MKSSSNSDKCLYELVNPSDPYTFYASSLYVAGVVAGLLSTHYVAVAVGNEENRTPVLFGWDEWVEERGIDGEWIDNHALELSEAFGSFLIGGPERRADIESMMDMLPEEKIHQWRDQRQERERSSLHKIGEIAYQWAAQLKAKHEKMTATTSPAPAPSP